MSNDVRWSVDLRWQSPDAPWGFYNIQEGLLLRSAKNPNLTIDWDKFLKVDRKEIWKQRYMKNVIFLVLNTITGDMKQHCTKNVILVVLIIIIGFESQPGHVGGKLSIDLGVGCYFSLDTIRQYTNMASLWSYLFYYTEQNAKHKRGKNYKHNFRFH